MVTYQHGLKLLQEYKLFSKSVEIFHEYSLLMNIETINPENSTLKRHIFKNQTNLKNSGSDPSDLDEIRVICLFVHFYPKRRLVQAFFIFGHYFGFYKHPQNHLFGNLISSKQKNRFLVLITTTAKGVLLIFLFKMVHLKYVKQQISVKKSFKHPRHQQLLELENAFSNSMIFNC